MCLLEGAEAARATASGMAAVTAALLGQVKAGDHVVSARALFGSCLYVVEELLPRFGVASTLVDGADLAQWEAAVRPETKVFFLESPTNPGLEVYDIKAISDIAHRHGARLVVDNVFASPILQKPLQLGADCYGLFDDQTYRRPGALPRRHHPVEPRIHRHAHPHFPAPDRPGAFALQCLGDAEVARNPAAARQPSGRERGADRRCSGRRIRT